MSGRTTIVLAEDHLIVREGLRALLSSQPDFVVVGEVASGAEVAQAVERLRPNVLVLDIALPDASGLEVTREIAQRAPKTRVVILSMHAAEGFVHEALHNGAAAYVVKDAAGAELVRAIHEVVAGRRYLSPPISEHAIAAYEQRVRSGHAPIYDDLTPREREVLRLAAEGLTSAEIGTRLDISPRTAETHRNNLMRKLGLHTRTDLVRFAFQQGMLPPV